uniref:USP domain-containing protein n=1 Tax=Heterorhabditis bacteriophora TaxID=37862 RepID=A0A1I7X1Z6_HETBA
MLCTKGVSYYRKYFCVTFGGWHVNTVKDERSYSDEENVFHRVVRHPSDDMRRKAVAYYRVCYERNIFTSIHSSKTLVCYRCWMHTILNTARPIGRSLDRVLFIVSEWADKSDLFCRRLQSHHLSLLVILFAINYFSSLNGNAKRFIDEIDDDVTLPSIEDKTMVLLFPSQLIVSFFEFLASRSFRKLDHLSFNHLGYNSVFLRGEWIPIHTVFTSFFYKIVEQFIIRELLINAAVKTYYNLVFNLRFEELPLCGECPELSRVTVSARGTLESLRILRHLVAVKPPIRSAARGKEISEQLSRLVYENIMRDD